MDLKTGDNAFILFLEEIEAEMLSPHDENDGVFRTFEANKATEQVFVVGVNEDQDSVDLELWNGRVIYSIPRESFSVVPF
jgi:hypothetical protein